MKKNYILGVLGVLSSTAVYADIFKVDSAIQTVTVYPNAAYIERQAKLHLPVGEHTLVFPSLSSQLLTPSLQFMTQGVAPLVLKGVEAKQAVDPEPTPSLKITQDAVEKVRQDYERAQDQLDIVDKQIDLIEILRKGAMTASTSNGQQFDIEAFKQIQQFSRESELSLQKERRVISDKLDELDKEITKLEQRFEEEQFKAAQQNNEVYVRVQVDKAGDYTLNLNYMNAGVNWRPSYQLYYDSKAQQISLQYYAQLYQRTFEDWKGVNVVFSTAAANRTNAAPETRPWFISFYQPAPPVARMAVPMMAAKSAAMDSVMLESADSVPVAAVAPEVDIETGNFASLFKLSGTKDLPSQEEVQGILLTQFSQKVDVEFAYYAGFAEKVYASIKGKNQMEYPLLAGELQTFYDGQFIGNGHLPMLLPEQEFKQIVGEDQTIQVSNSPLKRFEQKTGVINKTQVVKFEQSTKFTNARAESVTVKVYDRIPSSRHKDIVVKLISPDAKTIALDKVGRYEQSITLKAKESTNLTKSFTVEFPSDKQISGL